MWKGIADAINGRKGTACSGYGIAERMGACTMRRTVGTKAGLIGVQNLLGVLRAAVAVADEPSKLTVHGMCHACLH